MFQLDASIFVTLYNTSMLFAYIYFQSRYVEIEEIVTEIVTLYNTRNQPPVIPAHLKV